MSIEELRSINKILLRLAKKLDLSKLSATEIDKYLDSRDQNPFDSDWFLAYKEVENQKNEFNEITLQKIEELNEKLREAIFKNIIRITDSFDLAGYISDDFGLISDAFFISSFKKSWIFGLFDCYLNMKLPSGIVPILERPNIKSEN